jgi:hypothetical protein
MSIDLSKAASAPAWLESKPIPPTCLLCGAPTQYIGVWKRSGRRLVTVYGLCRTCARHADERIDRIERAIMAELAKLN